MSLPPGWGLPSVLSGTGINGQVTGPSPYTTGESKSYFQSFASSYQGPRNAAALRGVLYQCQDVGFLNTGVGLGYNTYANPFVCKPAAKQTVRQRYTGREFIFLNMAFSDCRVT